MRIRRAGQQAQLLSPRLPKHLPRNDGTPPRRKEGPDVVHDWLDFRAVKAAVSLPELLRACGVDWLRSRRPGHLEGRCPIHRGRRPDAFHVSQRVSLLCLSGGRQRAGLCRCYGTVSTSLIQKEIELPCEAPAYLNLNVAVNLRKLDNFIIEPTIRQERRLRGVKL